MMPASKNQKHVQSTKLPSERQPAKSKYEPMYQQDETSEVNKQRSTTDRSTNKTKQTDGGMMECVQWSCVIYQTLRLPLAHHEKYVENRNCNEGSPEQFEMTTNGTCNNMKAEVNSESRPNPKNETRKKQHLATVHRQVKLF